MNHQDEKYSKVSSKFSTNNTRTRTKEVYTGYYRLLKLIYDGAEDPKIYRGRICAEGFDERLKVLTVSRGRSKS